MARPKTWEMVPAPKPVAESGVPWGLKAERGPGSSGYPDVVLAVDAEGGGVAEAAAGDRERHRPVVGERR